MHGHLDRDAAFSPGGHRDGIDENHPIGFSEAPRLEPERFAPSLLQFGEPRPYPVVAAKDRRIRSLSKVMDLSVLIEGRDPRVVVASIEGGETRPYCVQISLGHS